MRIYYALSFRRKKSTVKLLTGAWCLTAVVGRRANLAVRALSRRLRPRSARGGYATGAATHSNPPET